MLLKEPMDSINQNQPEKNHEDLAGSEAVEKIKSLQKKASSCFFCTTIRTGQPFSTRPMAVQKIDDDGTLWFLSSVDSNKNEDLANDPIVQLLFQGSDYSDFFYIYGMATVSQDREKIKELWNPALKVWFTEGEDDPRITVIRVDPTDGYYWDTKHNKAVAFLKRAVGAITGKTLDDSIEGKLKV